jgi:hypothetical protein
MDKNYFLFKRPLLAIASKFLKRVNLPFIAQHKDH